MSINWSIDTHETVSSTQDIIKTRAEDGQPEGMVVQALEQTEGYGRHAREWVSEPGNLYLSLLLRPSCGVQEIGQLSLMAGLAAAQTIQGFMDEPDKLRLKWPNDVLIEGKKCAGLILETGLGADQSLEWVALGIGINLSAAPAEIGTHIEAYSDKPPTLDRLRHALLKEIATLYELWQAQGFGPIKAQWLARAHEKGDKVSVKIGDERREGSFHGIDEQGALLIHDEQFRVKKITSGDIYL